MLAKRVEKHLETLTAGKGEDFGKLRAELAVRIAESSSTASKLTEELVRLDGRAPASSSSRSSRSRLSGSRPSEQQLRATPGVIRKLQRCG